MPRPKSFCDGLPPHYFSRKKNGEGITLSFVVEERRRKLSSKGRETEGLGKIYLYVCVVFFLLFFILAHHRIGGRENKRRDTSCAYTMLP